MKKLIPLLGLLVLMVGSCKKAEELKEQIIKGYWKNADDVVLDIKEGEAYITDPGTSGMGSNTQVFDLKKTPFIKNIVRTGDANWKADVIKAIFEDDELVSAVYEATSIAMVTDEDGNASLNFSNATPGFTSWTKTNSPGNYDPNDEDPIKTDCDTTSQSMQDDNNIVISRDKDGSSLNDTARKFTVRAQWDKVLQYHSCSYFIEALKIGTYKNQDLEVVFGEKPKNGKKYKLTSFHPVNGAIDADEVYVAFRGCDTRLSGAENVTVSTGAGGITVKLENVELVDEDTYYDLTYFVAFTITVPALPE